MHYKTILKMHYFKKNSSFPMPIFIQYTMANLKPWVPFYSLELEEFEKSFYRPRIPIFSFKTCICLCMVEDRKFSTF